MAKNNQTTVIIIILILVAFGVMCWWNRDNSRRVPSTPVENFHQAVEFVENDKDYTNLDNIESETDLNEVEMEPSITGYHFSSGLGMGPGLVDGRRFHVTS